MSGIFDVFGEEDDRTDEERNAYEAELENRGLLERMFESEHDQRERRLLEEGRQGQFWADLLGGGDPLADDDGSSPRGFWAGFTGDREAEPPMTRTLFDIINDEAEIASNAEGEEYLREEVLPPEDPEPSYYGHRSSDPLPDQPRFPQSLTDDPTVEQAPEGSASQPVQPTAGGWPVLDADGDGLPGADLSTPPPAAEPPAAAPQPGQPTWDTYPGRR